MDEKHASPPSYSESASPLIPTQIFPPHPVPPVLPQNKYGQMMPHAAPINYGPDPQHVICSHCQTPITTRVENEATSRTHWAAFIICCLIWPCVCVPYCIDSCQNQNHYCPKCNQFLGVYEH